MKLRSVCCRLMSAALRISMVAQWNFFRALELRGASAPPMLENSISGVAAACAGSRFRRRRHATGHCHSNALAWYRRAL